MHHEQSLIAAFVKRSKRERYREILSSPRLRHKFTSQLAHFKDFDSRYRLSIPNRKLTISDIILELQRRQSPGVCFAISEDPAIDQKEFPLLAALRLTVGRGLGTVLSCIPGRLAFVETEDERFILQRSETLEMNEYIRFAIVWKDKENHFERGVFHAVTQALERRDITGSNAVELNDLLAWFGTHLQNPISEGRDKDRRGVCWFKVTAAEHISRVQQMVRILQRNGISVMRIRTDKPGYVIYEDEWQLVAEPARKGRTTRRG